MRPITDKTFGKDNGVQALTLQHPFHDVAVVAEQTPWLAGVMAMIGAYLLSFKGALANGTLSFLNSHHRVDVIRSKASSNLALTGNSLSPSLRVIPNLVVLLWPVPFVSGAPLGLGFWRSIKCGASSFYLGARGMFVPSQSNAFSVCRVVRISFRKISSPFLGCAVGLLLSLYHTTRSCVLRSLTDDVKTAMALC